MGTITDWLPEDGAFVRTAQIAGDLAARWVLEGRYAAVEDALDPAILAVFGVLEQEAPHIARLVLAEFDKAAAAAREDGVR